MKGYSGRTFRSGTVRRLLPGLVALAVATSAAASTERGATPAAPGSGARVDAPDAVSATPWRYLNIAGTAFHPVNSSTAYSYVGGGCINRTGSDMSLFTHKVVLPQGSVVQYLRLYYNDASSDSIYAFFTTYDMHGGFNERTTVSSSGNSGYGSALSPPAGYAIDHFAEPSVVTVNLNASTDASLQFCGVRIAYYDIGDDTIFKNGFD